MPLRLSVVTPARSLVDAQVDGVVAPGREGDFGVLPGHELFLAPLRPGVLRFDAGGREVRLAVSGGFAEVTQESVTILAPAAFLAQDLDRARVQEELERAEAGLRELGMLAPAPALESARERVEVARARLSILS